MTTGIGASLTTVTAGTTIRSADAMANWNALNNAGVSNDSGDITTSGSGGLTAVSLHTTGGGLICYLITPYQFVTSDSINSGNTKNYTCAGVGGVPSGAKAVIVNIGATAASSTGFATLTPHGTAWSAVNYPSTNVATGSSQTVNGSSLIVPLDGSGKLDIGAVNSNLTSINAQMYGYFY